MTKKEFLDALSLRLSSLPKQEVDERINFYSEMIDDRIEEGLSEEEAVLDIGSIDEISSQIAMDIPLTKIAKKAIKPKNKLRAWEIVLLVVGSPIWFSLLVAVFSVVVAIYASVWAIVISLWACFASLAVCGIAGILVGILFAILGNGISGLFTVGASLICLGLSVFTFFAVKLLTKYCALIIPKLVLSVKKSFVKKEVA